MRLLFPVLLIIGTFIGSGCQKSRPETLVDGEYDLQEMDSAIARARREVDQFITVMQTMQGSDFSVKVGISDGKETEHFWLTDIKYSNGEFSGLIGNDPGLVTNVKFGQPWKVKKTEISDWLYFKGGKMYGNYTIKPLLKNMPAEEAEALRKMLAEP